MRHTLATRPDELSFNGRIESSRDTSWVELWFTGFLGGPAHQTHLDGALWNLPTRHCGMCRVHFSRREIVESAGCTLVVRGFSNVRDALYSSEHCAMCGVHFIRREILEWAGCNLVVGRLWNVRDALWSSGDFGLCVLHFSRRDIVGCAGCT